MNNPFQDVTLRELSGIDRAWYESACGEAHAPPAQIAFRTAFAGLGRRLGERKPQAADVRRLEQAGVPFAAHWDLATIARVAYTVQAVPRLPPGERVAFLRTVFRRGDYNEQSAVLRSFSYLPEPRQFVELAVEACRTNVVDVLAAIACENAYPAEYFDDLAFNQMVLKGIFLGLDSHRVAGLERRVTKELQRMTADYGAERRAAGRVVPADIEYICAMKTA